MGVRERESERESGGIGEEWGKRKRGRVVTEREKMKRTREDVKNNRRHQRRARRSLWLATHWKL